MRDLYYGDSRDLVKWGAVAAHLARSPTVQRVVQVAFWRPLAQRYVVSDGITHGPLSAGVMSHFRDVHHIEPIGGTLGVAVDVFDREWTPLRPAYFDALVAELSSDPLVAFVLLDPDTGLAPPGSCGLEHVAAGEVQRVWAMIRPGGALALYQHARREKLRAWVSSTRSQYARALRLSDADVHSYECVDLASDVVIHVASRRD